VIYLDIETIPIGVPDPARVKVPRSYKDPAKIEQYRATHAEEEHAKGSLHALTGRVLCIGVAVGDDDPVCLYGGGTDEDEVRILDGLQRGLHGKRGDICTFNGNSFDLPFLVRRSWRHSMLHLAERLRPTKPWDTRFVDVRQVWGCGDFRPRGTLDEVAELLGIERPDNPIDGSEVWARYRAGDHDAIRAHVLDDVRTLRLVAQRLGVSP